MPAKIRLARRGRKFSKIYTIVVADGRAPRDGKYIETLGQYNPNTNPATIELDFDKSLEWLQKGAQPTDTCRAILSYKGVMYKKHLLEGVKKGAFDEAEAEKRFQSWMTAKEQKIQAKVDQLKSDDDSKRKERLDAEAKVNEERALEIEKQRSELLKEEAQESTEAEGETADAPAEEAVAEAPAAEATADKPAAEEKSTSAEATADKKEEKPASAEATADKPAAEAKEEKAEEKSTSAEATADKPAAEAKEEKAEEKSTSAEAPADKKEEKPASAEATADKPAAEAKEEKAEEKSTSAEATADKPAAEAKEEKAEEKSTSAEAPEDKKEDKKDK